MSRAYKPRPNSRWGVGLTRTRLGDTTRCLCMVADAHLRKGRLGNGSVWRDERSADCTVEDIELEGETALTLPGTMRGWSSVMTISVILKDDDIAWTQGDIAVESMRCVHLHSIGGIVLELRRKDVDVKVGTVLMSVEDNSITVSLREMVDGVTRITAVGSSETTSDTKEGEDEHGIAVKEANIGVGWQPMEVWL